jgi:AcrR family transcriptional regulator/DNA-binding MarR family transcriptional regulator
MAEFQRARLLRATLETVSERGYGGAPVAAILARAGVSRKTFYELFDSREDCLSAVFEESVARLARAVAPAYEAEGKWSERVRAALAALLTFLESERDVGAFALSHVVGYWPRGPEHRARLLELLERVVDEGRSQAKQGHTLSPLTAEVVVGGALAVIHARLQSSQQRLIALVNPLMWMIVLPYLGPAAAARELRRTPPEPAVRTSKPARGPLEGLDMRVTYRTARVLAAIAEEPGLSNSEISSHAEITDQGQISKLLARLAHLGLVENTGAGQQMGAANAWQLTSRGEEVDAAIRREFAAGGPGQSGR